MLATSPIMEVHHTLVCSCRGVHRVTDMEKFPVRISKMKLLSVGVSTG